MIRGIEVNFAVPVEITDEERRELADIVSRICKRSEASMPGHVHWPCGFGSKMLLSAKDAAFLGREPAAETERPRDGDEPSYDDGVYSIETCCRAAYPGERGWHCASGEEPPRGEE